MTAHRRLRAGAAAFSSLLISCQLIAGFLNDLEMPDIALSPVCSVSLTWRIYVRGISIGSSRGVFQRVKTVTVILVFSSVLTYRLTSPLWRFACYIVY